MRLFIAIQFDEKILSALTDFQESLKKLGVRGRFTPQENLHLTLAFIGEYGDYNFVLDAMNTIKFSPITIKLEGVGTFRDLYWAGIEKNFALESYVKKLRHALAEKNIPFDRKKFSPHITLIRNTTFLENKIPAINPPTGEFQANFASLMCSERGKNGMIYTEIGTT